MRPPREDTKPWYRQFWPWFLIALPGAAVIASMVTIQLAISDADSLVRDDYYKKGLAINRDLARERMAGDLGIRITLDYDAQTGQLSANMNDAPVGELNALVVRMVHPTLEQNDATIRLKKMGEMLYTGSTPSSFDSIDWHVTVEPDEETWKITARWNPLTQPSIVLAPAISGAVTR